MKKSLLLNLLLIILPLATIAQSIITGTVRHAQTQQPIAGAIVSANLNIKTETNQNGSYSLIAPADAAYLVISHIGFITDTIAIVAGASNEVQLWPRLNILPEVKVQGYETNRPLLLTAGAISTIDSDVIQQSDESSLVRAVNTVPGIRMEERTPASYRISIRGSSLRSPYGIRNVKLYFNGFPLTEANGTTALNMIDAAAIGSIEILKGPAGSLYGAGTGGTILLEPKRSKQGTTIQLAGTIGSFGLRKYNAGLAIGSAKSNMLVQYSRQQYNGYREHSAMDRHMLLISPEFYVNDKQIITSNIIYTNLFYELPGGLTEAQYDQNPKQARGGELGSIKQNASLAQQGLNIGLKQEYRFNDAWQNTTAVYGLYRFKDNPFNTDYERNTNQELGARSSFAYSTIINGIEVNYRFGGEFQRGFEAARTYDNNSGKTGALRTDDEVTATTGFVFGQMELNLPAGFILTTALSLNDTRYEITRLAQQPTINYTRDFDAVLSPRVALLKQLTERVSLHGSVSYGFSPPTEEEILTSDGNLNETLEAEKGINYEMGIRGYSLQNKLRFDVVGYHFTLKDAIVSRQETSSVAVFRNVGATSQQGLETNLNYTIADTPERWLSLLTTWVSYTYSHFRFKEYLKAGEDLSGNKLTGVAPHTIAAGANVSLKAGLYLNLITNYTDEVPLNDKNIVYADSYFTVSARAGFKKIIARQMQLDVFAGGDNLTDTKYSLGNDLNAFGGRYYQPAPSRNYYSGINLSYKFN
jgi:iron complex outermembrane recepter protein